MELLKFIFLIMFWKESNIRRSLWLRKNKINLAKTCRFQTEYPEIRGGVEGKFLKHFYFIIL